MEKELLKAAIDQSRNWQELFAVAMASLGMGEEMIELSKAEKIAALESEVASLKAAYESAEWQLELLKGSGPILDKFFSEIDASDRTYEEVIEFLSTTK